MATRQDIIEEQIRMIRLRLLVDLTTYRLRYASLSRQEALALIERTHAHILSLFPDKDGVFDLVLRPRFLRILNERALAEWGIADAIN
jgi:hypothetical protein